MPEPSEVADPSHAARIAHNFLALMGDSLPDIAAFLGRMLLSVVLWGALGVFAGAVLGIVIYRRAFRARLTAVPFGWHRYARHAWPFLFLLSSAAGLAIGGVWVGAGRCVTEHIDERHMLDRIVLDLYFAVRLDSADYQASGKESVAQLQAKLAESEALRPELAEDFDHAVDGFATEHGTSWPKRALLAVLAPVVRVTVAQLSSKSGIDLELIVLMARSPDEVAAYAKEHPSAPAQIAAVTGVLQTGRREACRLVNGAIYPNAAIAALLGLGLPILAAVILLLVARRNRPPQHP
jgi:hypothetical protein